jgi:pimeloyl-ACP methyl ester carboxylesterase
MSNYLSAGNVSLHFQQIGQGENVILIHGLGANLAFWYMGIARLLAPHCNVVTYDLRGHGRSSMPERGYRLAQMADDLHQLLGYLNITRAHIVGHSFGARVALTYAIANPQRVVSLTVADTQVSCLQPPMRLREWSYWPIWKKQLLSQGFNSFPSEDEAISFQMLAHFNQFSSGFTHGSLNRKRLAPSLKRRDMGARGAVSWDRLMSSTTAKADFAMDSEITPEGIRSLKMPMLAAFGEYSHCLATCVKLKELVPHTEVRILPEVGHFHPAIKPRLFVRTLWQFLNNHHHLSHLREMYRGPDRRNAIDHANFPFQDRFGNFIDRDRRQAGIE